MRYIARNVRHWLRRVCGFRSYRLHCWGILPLFKWLEIRDADCPNIRVDARPFVTLVIFHTKCSTLQDIARLACSPTPRISDVGARVRPPRSCQQQKSTAPIANHRAQRAPACSSSSAIRSLFVLLSLYYSLSLTLRSLPNYLLHASDPCPATRHLSRKITTSAAIPAYTDDIFL